MSEDTTPEPQQVNRTSEVETQPVIQRDELTGVDLELDALIEAMKPRSNIDPELLLQFFRNPSMLEHIMNEIGLSAISAQPQARPSAPLPCRIAPNPVVIGQPGVLSSVKQHGLSTTSPRHQERSCVLLPCRITSSPVVKVKPGVATSGLPLTCRPVSVPGPTITENLANVPVGANSTWYPSVPFTYSISQEAKYIMERVKMSVSLSNLSMPLAMVNSGSIPSSSKVDLGKIRKHINEYGLSSGRDGAECRYAYSPYVHGTVPIVTKDLDYCRRLVLQHGMGQENHNPQGYVKTIVTSPTESKPQQRPCAYFNMAKGCRRGSSCWFKHIKVNLEGSPHAVEEQQRAKRMKLSGRNFV